MPTLCQLKPVSTGLRILNGSFARSLSPLPTPMTFPPCPTPTPTATLQSTQPTQRETHDRPHQKRHPKPDPQVRLRHRTLCQLQLSYAHVTNVTRFSYKNLRRSYERCAIPATKGHTCDCTPATKRRHAATQLCHATHPQIQKPCHECHRPVPAHPPAAGPLAKGKELSRGLPPRG